jgi:CRISPR-associated exonuclease Cas4
MHEDLIPLAMLNALAYCPRRYGYEYLRAEMLLNEHVVEGQIRHQQVDQHGQFWRADAIQQHRMYVWSQRLGIGGFCDLVELQDQSLYPVEYKKGRLGRWRNDHVQLCAQALCLEERSGQQIEQGAIYSFANRHREQVVFDSELRNYTEQIIRQAHEIAKQGILPAHTEQTAKCRECSLNALCLPKEFRLLRKYASQGEQHADSILD